MRQSIKEQLRRVHLSNYRTKHGRANKSVMGRYSEEPP